MHKIQGLHARDLIRSLQLHTPLGRSIETHCHASAYSCCRHDDSINVLTIPATCRCTGLFISYGYICVLPINIVGWKQLWWSLLDILPHYTLHVFMPNALTETSEYSASIYFYHRSSEAIARCGRFIAAAHFLQFSLVSSSRPTAPRRPL